MKTIEYRVTVQSQVASRTFIVRVKARNINSGVKKAVALAPQFMATYDEFVSVEFWQVV